MNNELVNETISCPQQEQMLRLITKGFYKEITKYGIHEKDIITISTFLLDYLISDKDFRRKNDFYNKLFTIKDIDDGWNANKKLKIKDVSIYPLMFMPKMYFQVAEWLKNPFIKYSFISLFPEPVNDLKQYIEHKDRYFFCILYNNEPIGVIGADNIDKYSKKLEMKKFIGNVDLHGKGIGKLATFLFHYYCFCILDFNKIYIYSGDTNIHNINLNCKFGYELEGIFLDEFNINNEIHDIVRMGVLKSRWMEIFSGHKMT